MKAWYCDADVVQNDPDHKHYHDHEYGFPLTSDDQLFERLCLEINQAGLSWTTILRKRKAFHLAYRGFHIPTVASFDDLDRKRLMDDPGIIRNRLKINAAIHNAQRILNLGDGFKAWLDHHHPLDLPQWIKLFKRTFLFSGPQIVNEFLMSTGYLPDAHKPTCPIYKKLNH